MFKGIVVSVMDYRLVPAEKFAILSRLSYGLFITTYSNLKLQMLRRLIASKHAHFDCY